MRPANTTASLLAVKIITLTAAVALTVISCAPEIDLTDRDWKKKTADQDTAKLSVDSENMKPSLAWSNLNSSGRDPYREVAIFFPARADVLQASGSDITDKLKEFMALRTYIKGITPTDADTLGGNIDYTFLRKMPVFNGTNIVIRLDTVPSDSFVVVKIDASKYTYDGGRKLGGSGDTNPGSAYYDVYFTCSVEGATPERPDNFSPPYRVWTLNIGFSSENYPDGDTVSSVQNTRIPVAWLSGADVFRFQDTIMPGLERHFKLKQYRNNSWEDASGTFDTDNSAINLSFLPVEFTPYRIEVENAQRLTVGPYYGVMQRIGVSGAHTTAGYNRDVVASNNYLWIDTFKDGRTLATGNSAAASGLISVRRIEPDRGGRNVVLRLAFNGISDPETGGIVYLREMNLDDFRKNCKIVYRKNNTALSTIAQVKAANDLCFIDIKGIAYVTTNSNRDEIRLTLDPNYQYNPAGTKYFLFAPGFKYDNNNIIFGNYGNWEFEIDGVKYFDNYGSLNF